MVKAANLDVVGPLVYKNLFEYAPDALQMFPYKDTKDFITSAIVKKQSASVLRVIGRGIENLQDFDSIQNVFHALGVEHKGREITQEHYDLLLEALKITLVQLLPSHMD